MSDQPPPAASFFVRFRHRETKKVVGMMLKTLDHAKEAKRDYPIKNASFEYLDCWQLNPAEVIL